jgi:Cu(I)/Ag(I) efflux system membrane fusion protein
VTVAGDQARPLNGRVGAILPEVSGETRTLQVRVELPNPGGRLRPGGFATVALAGGARPALVVPSEAVIRTGRRALVMLALADGRFQPAEVQVGAEAGDRTEILSGLSEGERIIASGQFLIDSEASLAGIQARPSAPMATTQSMMKDAGQ